MRATGRRPLLLDLFCGAGGAAYGYWLAGFDIMGVDSQPQPRYPFDFIQADALDEDLLWILEPDAIHASPPCQAHSDMRFNWNARTDYPDLIAPTRALLAGSGLPYVIENVPRAPLLDPVTLCGSMFGLDVRRHRSFESSHELCALGRCRHGTAQVVGVYGHGGGRGSARYGRSGTLQECRDAMHIPWMIRREISQAIPPAYTAWLGLQLLDHVA